MDLRSLKTPVQLASTEKAIQMVLNCRLARQIPVTRAKTKQSSKLLTPQELLIKKLKSMDASQLKLFKEKIS